MIKFPYYNVSKDILKIAAAADQLPAIYTLFTPVRTETLIAKDMGCRWN